MQVGDARPNRACVLQADCPVSWVVKGFKGHLYEIPRIVKFMESESTLVEARGQGLGRRKGMRSSCLMGTISV